MICTICGWDNDPLACMGQCRHALGEFEIDMTGKTMWKDVVIPDWWPFEPRTMWPEGFEPVWNSEERIKAGNMYCTLNGDGWSRTGDARLSYTVSERRSHLLYVRKVE